METKEKTTSPSAQAKQNQPSANEPKKTKKDKKAQEAVQSAEKAPFAVIEAYKNIRVYLVSALAKIGGKSIVVSSPFASDGKSTTTINLAVTLSQLGKNVVLIDADSRRGTIHQKLKIANDKGLMDILSETSTFEDVVIKHNAHLDILTFGSNINNPAELLSSKVFDSLLASLEEAYDYIVIDTPPFNVVSDALVIAQKTSGLVLVARSGITPYGAFNKALTTANSLNINVLGVVINGIGGNNGKYGKYGKYNKYYKYYDKYGYSKYDYTNKHTN